MSIYFNQTNLTPGDSFAAQIEQQANNVSTLTVSQLLCSTIRNSVATSQLNPIYTPIQFNLNPNLAAQGGSVQAIFNWDAADTGYNVACVIGANSNNAFVGSQWLNYITTPLNIYGATITLESDNETFLFGNGNSGAIGTLSTGVPFLSAQNNMSSLNAPGTSNANLGALLSTLQATYPACFS